MTVLTPAQILELERLRAFKQAPTPRRELAPFLESAQKSLQKQRRASPQIQAAWDGVVPAELREIASPIGLARGVLRIKVRDAAAVYQLEKFLRGGGEVELVRRCGVAIRSVKLMV